MIKPTDDSNKPDFTTGKATPGDLHQAGLDDLERETVFAFNLVEQIFGFKQDADALEYLAQSQRQLRKAVDELGLTLVLPVEPLPGKTIFARVSNVFPEVVIDGEHESVSLKLAVSFFQQARPPMNSLPETLHALGDSMVSLEQFGSVVEPASANRTLEKILAALVKTEREKRLANEKLKADKAKAAPPKAPDLATVLAQLLKQANIKPA